MVKCGQIRMVVRLGSVGDVCLCWIKFMHGGVFYRGHVRLVRQGCEMGN